MLETALKIILVAFIAGVNSLESLIDESEKHFDWMIQHFDFINKTDNPDKEDSPELTADKEHLKLLRGIK